MSDTPAPDWPGLLTALLAGQDLTRAQAGWAMEQVMAGVATPAQVAGLAVALRAKGESAAEVAGLVDSMLAHATRITVPQPALDVVGTGGDRSHTVNISTMTSLVAAAAGARVVKHGGRAQSSRSGSADVLEALGVVVDLEPAAVVECVETLGIGFCFAPRFHAAMRHAGPARRELGVPTVFNILGPLANPAAPAAALVGCAEARLAPVMAGVIAGAGQRALVVRGDDGLDEVTTGGLTLVWDTTAGDGTVEETSIDSVALGLPIPEADALRGGDASFNAEVARAVLGGASEGRLGAVRDAVALNTAAALVAESACHGTPDPRPLPERVAAALPRAREVLASGAAGDLLDRWAALTRRLAPEG